MKVQHTAKEIPQIPGARIAIVRTKWYVDQIDSMVTKCKQYLEVAGCEAVEEHTVPGAVELPLAVQTLIRARQGTLDAVVCFGGIVKGETFHFEMITAECMRGLGEVMLREATPIIVEVIPVIDIEHLIARAADDHKNKGIEAAYAAAEIIAWRKSL